MSRLIDADAIKRKANAILVCCSGYPNCSEADYEYECAMHDAKHKISAIIDDAPTIDPVRHGRWVDWGVRNSTGQIYQCSACNAFYNQIA